MLLVGFPPVLSVVVPPPDVVVCVVVVVEPPVAGVLSVVDDVVEDVVEDAEDELSPPLLSSALEKRRESIFFEKFLIYLNSGSRLKKHYDEDFDCLYKGRPVIILPSTILV